MVILLGCRVCVFSLFPFSPPLPFLPCLFWFVWSSLSVTGWAWLTYFSAAASPPMARPAQTVTHSLPPAHPAEEEPMQLGRAKLTTEERLHRRRAGECLYCAQVGHFVTTCPLHPKDRARQ